jgi:ABC-2 type transport system permease protein
MTADQLTETPAIGKRTRWFVADSVEIARRNIAHVRQIPEKLIDVTLQPLMFVLLFGFVFGGVVAVPGGGDYREYLIGGILVQTIAFGLVGPATALATDLTEGIVDRFRTLPMSRPAFLVGHMIAALAATCVSLAVLGLSGLIIGWRINTGVLQALEGFGLLLVFAFAMLWIGALIGLLVRSPDAVMGIAFLVVFPMTFLAGTFVPLDGLPGGLHVVAEYNPVTSLAAATRELFGNPTALPADPPWTLAHPVVSSLLWCAALLAVAVPLTLRRFRAKTTG